MSHRARQDVPGSWHHVMNRGIARRPTFENRRDMRFFLSRLARAARRYEVEIHAYSLLTTHFHLLVRSVRGNLSKAIGWVENQYVRWFNRSRRRDGSLFRGRFTSRPVSTDAYWRVLVRYIDLNAVSAGLAPRAVDYGFCSARDYGRRHGPPWLTRTEVEEVVRSSTGLHSYEPQAYERVFHPDLQPSVEWLVERRLQLPHVEDDPLDDLLALPAEKVRDWMRRKAALADGSSPGLPLGDPSTALSVVGKLETDAPDWSIQNGGRSKPGWSLLRVGILRDTCGLRIEEIAGRLQVSPTTVHRLSREHFRLLDANPVYQARSTEALTRLLEATFGWKK